MAEPDKKTEDLESVTIIGVAPIQGQNLGHATPPEEDTDFVRSDRPDEYRETGMTGDPSDSSSRDDRTMTSFDYPHREADSITGTFDAFAANVDKVFYAKAEAVSGKVQAIQYTRCGVDYGTNNWPDTYTAPTAWSQTQTQIGLALPWPARHDQEAYHVEADDIVMIVEGRDGRRWFMADDLPFVGVVLGAGTNSGSGDGLTSVQVRRQAIEGDPAALELSDLLDPDGTEIDYADVWIVDEDGADQGYETDDRILVHRRGSFLFAAAKAAPSAEMLFCKIVMSASFVGGGSLLYSTANPCDSNGRNVDSGTTLYIYHRWMDNITSNEMTTFPHLVAGDVKAYHPFQHDPAGAGDMEACGILAGDGCLPEGPFDTDDVYKVTQANNTGRLILNYVFAVDI